MGRGVAAYMRTFRAPALPMTSPQTCPACRATVPANQLTCDCGYGVAARPLPARDPNHRPAYLGDTGAPTIDERAESYRCTVCKSYGADLDRISTTGAGLTKLMNWQYKDFVALTCRFCGATQLFRADRLERQRSLWTALDFFD